jgi:hypothetical protein
VVNPILLVHFENVCRYATIRTSLFFLSLNELCYFLQIRTRPRTGQRNRPASVHSSSAPSWPDHEPDSVLEEHSGQGHVEAPARMALPLAGRHRQVAAAGLLHNHQEAYGPGHDQEAA